MGNNGRRRHPRARRRARRDTSSLVEANPYLFARRVAGAPGASSSAVQKAGCTGLFLATLPRQPAPRRRSRCCVASDPPSLAEVVDDYCFALDHRGRGHLLTCTPKLKAAVVLDSAELVVSLLHRIRGSHRATEELSALARKFADVFGLGGLGGG